MSEHGVERESTGAAVEAAPGRTEVREVIRELVAEVAGCPPAEIGDDARLDDLGIDSLLIVEVVVAIDRRFGVSVPPSEFRGDIRRVGDVCDVLGGYVESALAGSTPAVP